MERKKESDDLTFEEMMQLYDIHPPLTIDKLKVAKKKLLLLHPDKNKIDTTFHYMKFRNIYEQIFYYGKNNKYVVDEEISKLQGTSTSEYYKLITTKIGKENPNGKCIPLT
jgi:hypothetical protein